MRRVKAEQLPDAEKIEPVRVEEGRFLAGRELRVEADAEMTRKMTGLQEKAANEDFVLGDAVDAAEKKDSEIDRRRALKKIGMYILSSTISFGVAQEAIINTTQAAAPSVVKKEKIDQNLVRWAEKKKREDFEYVKSVIEQGKIEEKVGYLTREFGNNPGKFLRDARFAIKLTKEIEEDKKNGKPNIFVNEEDPNCRSKASPFCFIRPYWTNLTKEEKLTRCGDLKVSGFNEINKIFGYQDADWKGDSDKRIKDELKKRYSPQWFASTKEITYKDRDQAMPESYGLKNKGLVLGEAQEGFLQLEPGKIVLYKRNSYNFDGIMRTLHHEIAHHNDWRNSQLLSQQQKIEFLYDAARSFKNTENFASPYVYSIENQDKQLEAYLRVSEYWAVLTEQYMQAGGEKYRETNPVEAKLFEKWFNIINDVKK